MGESRGRTAFGRLGGLTLRVAAWLGIGAVVSVLVAWGCALWSPECGLQPEGSFSAEWAERLEPPGEAFPIRDGRIAMGESYPMVYTTAHHARLGVSVSLVRCHVRNPWRATDTRIAVLAGWPFRSLWCMTQGTTAHAKGSEGWVGGLVGPSFVAPRDFPIMNALELQPATTARETRPIPMRILARGFIANSVFFGSLVPLALLGARPFRRSLRLRRGRCPRCGYGLSGLQHHPAPAPSDRSVVTCPECAEVVVRG